MATRMQTPGVAAGPLPPGVASDVPGGNFVPFVRAAAPPRTQISITTSATLLTGSQQSVLNTLPGTGYLIWIDNFVQITTGTAANTSTNSVAFFEDGPWSTLASVTLDDGGPQNVNIDGFSLYLVNIYGGGWTARDLALSTDTISVFATASGTGASAGTANFWLRVPLAVNERNYWGLMGRALPAHSVTDEANGAVRGKSFGIIPMVGFGRSVTTVCTETAELAA